MKNKQYKIAVAGTGGPLQTLKGTIRKIDRHKRTAVVQMKMMGRLQDVTMGLEIVRKVK